MKQNKIQIIGSFMMISILFAMTIYTIICIGLKFVHLSIKENIATVNVNFKELYPFENEEEVSEKKNVIEKYKVIMTKIEDKIEKYTSEKLIGYEKMIECSYLYNDLISYQLVSNVDGSTRIELEDEFLSRLMKKNDAKCSNKLIELKEYLNNSGIDLLYIQAPYKISQTQKLSSIYQDYSNHNINCLLKSIEGKVDYIDLRENIKNNGLNHLKLFYKTDHHWLPETGLWATGEISDYLNEHYNMNLEINNIVPQNYNMKKYERMFLGADGRYVSLKNAELEDFTLITPKFDTKLKVKILDKGINKTDTFQNTLIDWTKVKYGDYYNNSLYDAYMHGNTGLIEIHNELVKNDKKILLIRDSFGAVVGPFLALENEDLSIIDLRWFDGSLKTYISQFKPDFVIILYNGNVITDDLTDSIWNFE